MLITKIVKSRKGRDSYAVYLDEALAFHASESILMRFGLRRGMQLDQESVEEVALASSVEEARAIAINLISYRPRSSKELNDKLKQKGFSAEVACGAIRHLQDINLLNDLEFARMLVRDKLRGKPMGRAMVRRKLLEKGIAFQIVERVLKEYISEDDEREAAARLAARKLKLSRSRFADLDTSRRRKRMMDYLLGRGFSTDVALKTVRTVFP